MSLNATGVDAAGLLAGADALSRPSDEYGNDSRVEALWAMKAVEHAEVYFNILCSVSPSQIPRLSPCDDEIYNEFRKRFPKMNVEKLDEVADLKNETIKSEWREFCELFKHVQDYNFATLLRLDSSKDYEESNSVISTKVQFYAVELARNREGHNETIRHNYKPKPRRNRTQPQTNTTQAEEQPRMMGSELEHELKQILTGSHPLLK